MYGSLHTNAYHAVSSWIDRQSPQLRNLLTQVLDRYVEAVMSEQSARDTLIELAGDDEYEGYGPIELELPYATVCGGRHAYQHVLLDAGCPHELLTQLFYAR